MLHIAALGTAVWLGGGCDDGIDTQRIAPPKATLGDDIYSVMCDRLGASSFNEDLTGASFHAICHFDENAQYGNEVDTSVLPTVSGGAALQARQLSIAKLELMAERRSALIHAINAAFPDITIADPTTDDTGDTIRLHDALVTFTQDITKLYETNPYEPEEPPIMPMLTSAFGRLFQAMEDHEEARDAFGRIAGRQGYRPYQVQLGAVRTLLAYPELRPFVEAQLEVLGPDGTAVPALQQLLTVMKAELLSSTPTDPPPPEYVVDPTTASPNRPRFAIEVAQALLLDQHDDYAFSMDEPRYIARRDGRGFAIPLGNVPGVFGTVPAPFADLDGDGLADVDQSGRFVDGAGSQLAVESPFLVPGLPYGPTDGFGRSSASLYQYVDTTRTLVGALAGDLTYLVDPTKKASEGSSAPWLEENEAVMYALSGTQVLAGPREAAQYDPVSEQVYPAGVPCSVTLTPESEALFGAQDCVQYERFVAEQSPLPDLIHALGQVLADPDSDTMLLALMNLIQDHPDKVARLMGAALRIKAIADEHDAAAAAGNEDKAELAYEVPIWDEMAQIVDDMVDHPGLMARLLHALADPVNVQAHAQDPLIQQPPAQHFGETLAAIMTMRDQYRYDWYDVNGPSINLTDGYPSLANPHNPVDRTQPLVDDNRSMFERSAQLIFDGNRIKACNKQGARIYTGFPIAEYWPLVGGYDECELFAFNNVGAFYLNANLPSTHPKRAEMVIQAADLNVLLDLLSGITSVDALLQASSGVDGLTTHPTPQALNRLLFFGANSDEWGQLPDFDTENAGLATDLFVSNAVEPVSGKVCPEKPNGVRACALEKDLLRLRDYAVIFGWERLGFYQYLAPQLQAFAETSCTPSLSFCDTEDYTGENFFLDLVSTLWRHWPGPDHGNNCDSTVAASNPRYCSGAGVNRYEPIVGDAFSGDIIPALHEFAVTVDELSEVTVLRGASQAEGCGTGAVAQHFCKGEVVSGSEVVEWIAKIMFDSDYAAEHGITDRFGNASTTWVDGTPQPQVTVFSMFAEALHAMDTRFDDVADGAERQAKWKRARSLLVDRFLDVSGEGPTTTWANPATPRAMITLLGVLREQLNANCPDREISGECAWARTELSAKFEATLSRPAFAAISDLTDKINAHEPARRELERFLSYALLSASSQDALQGMLASMSDVMQLLRADNDFAPIFNAVATASAPRDDENGPGCADRTIQLLKAMTDESYDRYHVIDHILPALVTPMDVDARVTPLEVIMEAVADINRVDAAALGTPLEADDYLYVFQTLREFLTSETRGFEQLYFIVQNRPRP